MKWLVDWFRNWVMGVRKDPLERRASPRRAVVGLTAHYWGGTGTAGHIVRDISLSGAFILADFKWIPGTILTMTLRLADEGSGSTSCPSLVVQAKVVRHGQGGIGVQFLCDSEAERKSLKKFVQDCIPNY